MINLLSPISPAVDRTVAQLFRPFDIGKWFALGFTAWLASFLSGATNFSGNYNTPSDFKNANVQSSTDFQHLISWGLPTWIGIAVGVCLVIWLFVAIFIWLGCRGHFMFLDNTLHNRCAIKAPWKAFRQKGNSLFAVHLALSLVIFVSMVATVICALVVFWPNNTENLTSRPPDWTYFLPLIISGSIFVLLWIGISLILMFLRDFGALWMYRHNVSAWEALKKVSVLATHEPLVFLLYVLIRILIGIIFVMTAMMLGCATCCIGCLPYLSSVLTLPLSVFLVWYTVGCFAQFGSEYDVQLSDELPPALPPGAVG